MVFPAVPLTAEEKVNLINESTTIHSASPHSNASFEDGVFKELNPVGSHLSLLKIPGLINQYSWSGDVKILEYGNDSGASGVRFCIGYNGDNYLNLILTRKVGVSAEKLGTGAELDVYRLTKDGFDRELNPGTEFHFEIKKQGNYVRLLVDGEVVMDTAFADRYDFFTPGNDRNIGFNSSNCSFEVRNIKVYNEAELQLDSEHKLTFDELALGTLARGRYSNWYIEWPSTNYSGVSLHDGTKALEVKGYFQSVFAYPVRRKYSVGVSMISKIDSSNTGLFIRSSNDRILTHSDNAPHAEYFEADKAGSIAGTGLFLKPLHGKNIIQIVVKQYNEEAASKVQSQAVSLDIADILGDNDQTTSVANYRFEDDGSIINAYVNDTLVVIIELSKETITYPRLNQAKNFGPSRDSYVKSVTIKSPDGNVLKTVNNTMVCAEYSVMGVASRSHSSSHPYYIYELDVEMELEKIHTPKHVEYAGSQIRTTLVPYKSQSGNLDLEDLRQGLRFAFDVPEINDTIGYMGRRYTVVDNGALVVLEKNIGDLSLLTYENIDNYKIALQDKLIEVEDAGFTYQSAYIYNIPKEARNEMIAARAFIKCEDENGNVIYLYSDVQIQSVLSVYETIKNAGIELPEDIKEWCEDEI